MLVTGGNSYDRAALSRLEGNKKHLTQKLNYNFNNS